MLKTSFATVLLFATVTGQFLFHINVHTGPNFEPQDGIMTLNLKSSMYVHLIPIQNGTTRLTPLTDFSCDVDSMINGTDVEAASFDWSSFPQTASGPIVVEKATVIPVYMDEPERSNFTRNFCLTGQLNANYIYPMQKC